MIMSKTDEAELKRISSEHRKILKDYKGSPDPNSPVFPTDDIITEGDYNRKFGDEKRYE